jgi:alkyl hydroperoxide reductase subunit AhpC
MTACYHEMTREYHVLQQRLVIIMSPDEVYSHQQWLVQQQSKKMRMAVAANKQ